MSKMNIEQVVIARKWSGLEWRAQQSRRSVEEVLLGEKKLGVDTDIIEGHYRQEVFLEHFFTKLPELTNASLLVGDKLDRKLLRRAELVIIMGGDNYFQHVSHTLSDQLVVGINNDLSKSNGGFARFDMDSLAINLPNILCGDYNIEEWTRLQTAINGRVLPKLAISEVLIAASRRSAMTRYQLDIGDEHGMQKNSGLLIVTGYGSASYGFYNNANQDFYQDEDYFPPYVNLAAFYVTELERRAQFSLKTGDLDLGEKLRLKWLGHSMATVEPDAGSRPFWLIKRGDVIEVGISDKPLKVVVP